MDDSSRKWWILSVTSLGSLLSALNFSTLIIALPELIRDLHSTLLQAMWVMLAYMVAQTVVVLLAGSLADRFGRKRLYIWGLILFTAASLAAGFMPGAASLIVMRVLQGIGGAMVMANSTAIVADAFPKNDLGRALGVNIMVVAVGQIIGPVLGGWLTTAFGWEWTFWFNVPFGVLAIVWSMIAMGFKDKKNPLAQAKRADVGGLITYVISVTGLLIALTWGPIQTWNSPVVWISGALFLICFPIFMRLERRHPHALLHLPLFSNRTFSMGMISATLNGIARMSVMFVLIFYFQGALGYDALEAGIMTIPLAVGLLIMSPIAGWMGDKMGERMPATLGLLINIIGLVGLAMDTGMHTPYWHLAIWMTITSVGAGLFNSPNTSSVMNAAGPSFRGEASGIRSLTVNMGMMLAIAFTMPVITNSIPHEAMLAIFSGTKVGMDGDTSSMDGFINGIHGVFWLMAVLMVIATVMSYLRASSSKTESGVPAAATGKSAKN